MRLLPFLGLENYFCILNHYLFPWISLGSFDSFILLMRINVLSKATARLPSLRYQTMRLAESVRNNPRGLRDLKITIDSFENTIDIQ